MLGGNERQRNFSLLWMLVELSGTPRVVNLASYTATLKRVNGNCTVVIYENISINKIQTYLWKEPLLRKNVLCKFVYEYRERYI